MPELVDTTLRDGEQCPGVAFTAEQRLAVAGALADAGVNEIEAGTPAIGCEECDAIRSIARLGLPCRITAWCRARRDDLERASACGMDAVHLSFPVSSILLGALRKCENWLFDQVAQLVPLARRRFAFVSVGAQDASRADRPFLLRFAATAAGAGADRLRLADTVGVWDPLSVRAMVQIIRRAVPSLRIGVHMHNDLGLAVANSLAALQSGAESADVTVLGLGERAGNAALEQLAMALRVTGIPCDVRPQRLTGLARLVAKASGQNIAHAQPIVGPGIFDHESGIHVQATLRDPRAYEPFAPETIGHAGRRLILGKHSGGASLHHALREIGIEPNEDGVASLLPQVRSFAISQRRPPTSAELGRLYFLCCTQAPRTARIH